MKNLIFSVLILTFLFSCQNDKSNYSPMLTKAEKAVEDDPSQENLEALVKAIIVEYESVEDKSQKIELLNKGLKIAEEHKMTKDINSFRLGLITEDPQSIESGNILLTMAKEVKARKNTDIADIMLLGVANEFENLSESARSELSNPDANPDSLIAKAGRLIFPEDNPTQINKGVARTYVDMCEAYALANPSSEKSVDYLFKGAEMARSLKSLGKAMSLYDMIILKYPNSKKAASALFVKAFVMENNYQKIEEAKALYLQFIEQYPNDELADDVEILLNNLGKSDEELYNAVKPK